MSMAGFPKAQWTEEDISFFIASLLKGICCFLMVTERGPVGKAIKVASWPEFQRLCGGMVAYSDAPLGVQRFFNRGGVAWIGRVAHYTDISNPATLTAVKSAITMQDRAATPVNTLSIKASSEGTWGNDLQIEIGAATLDPDNCFRLVVKDKNTGEILDAFDELSMNNASQDWIENRINNKGQRLIEVDDMESGSAAPTDRPAIGTYSLVNGNNGLTGLADSDYIGDSAAKTGFYMFDEVDDSQNLFAPGVTSPAVVAAGIGYADNRADMVFYHETPFDLEPAEAREYRLGTGAYSHPAFNSNYSSIFFGKPKVYDPQINGNKTISPLWDFAGVLNYNDRVKGEGWAPFGYRRGKVPNAVGIDFNVGTKARVGLADDLCNNQINCLIQDDYGLTFFGNYTTQRAASALQSLHVRRLLIFMKKSIMPFTKMFLHEPNDPVEWRMMYRIVRPFMEELKDKRWIYGHLLQFDQDAFFDEQGNLKNAKLNTPENIDRREYYCRIFVKPARDMAYIGVKAVITRTDANFEELLNIKEF